MLLGRVSCINKQEKTVALEDGDVISYDYLVLAPGAKYNYFGNDVWKKNAPSLKTLENALQIRERILLSLEKAEKIECLEKRKPFLTYVVIGAGPTGVEMAGSIAEIAKRNMMRDFRNFHRNETTIYLIEATGHVLNGFPEKLSNNALNALTGMGVHVIFNSPVQKTTEQGVHLKNHFIETPNVIWAAGVSASSLLKELDEEMDRSGRVKVQKDLSISSDDHIFVLGDAAHFVGKDGNPLIGVAPVALQQGKFLGKLIRDEIGSSKVRGEFSYLDKGTMATIGRAKAVADIRGFKLTGFLAWVIWGFVHVFFLIGFRNRFRVFAEWGWYYITFKRGVRLIAKKENIPG